MNSIFDNDIRSTFLYYKQQESVVETENYYDHRYDIYHSVRLVYRNLVTFVLLLSLESMVYIICYDQVFTTLNK